MKLKQKYMELQNELKEKSARYEDEIGAKNKMLEEKEKRIESNRRHLQEKDHELEYLRTNYNQNHHRSLNGQSSSNLQISQIQHLSRD